ncbi:tubulin epsilon and delta complex protein 2 [Microcaecilia unicolor]|uniref:Tubulin epsilon and delta complex protein 2 n=1 Tax=Microcaecilia unicolor TaxID=1415580 RepID=A0A6P7YZ76_9AMPH|nr:tubulin epsilon and delta complex protein 2 [Microcaecilia unicolor]XP_030068780.1 tubulin epsilon and delta complex protein 2 [Microcaecilia unicolor]
MLPTDCAQRLLSILNRAQEDCTEQKKQLEEHLSISRTLIGKWKINVPGNPKQEASNENEHGDEPSPEECRDLELLNKALAKALRIRESILATGSKVQGDAKGIEKGVDKKPAPRNSAGHQKSTCKERTPKSITATSTSKTSEPIKKNSCYLLKAPYRTDPERKRTRGVATSRLPSKGSKSVGRGAVKASVPHKTQVSNSADKLDLEQGCNGPEVMDSPVVESVREDSKVTKKLLKGPEKNLDHPAEEGLAESQTTQRNSKENAMPPSHIFTLKEQGVTLRLPLSYRTAYVKNASLWEKSYIYQKNRAESAPGMQFIQRIQATFDSVMPAVSPAMLEEEVTCLTNGYTFMHQKLEAEQFVEEDTDVLSWEDEYSRLLTLEGLQNVVSHCLLKLQELLKAAEVHMKMDYGDCSKISTLADCAVFSEPKCRVVGSMTSPLLFYSSVQELKEMAALKLRMQVLHQQLAIQKVLASELLPLLDSEYVQPLFYRAIYTLLCEAGEQFPVLIRDDLSD